MGKNSPAGSATTVATSRMPLARRGPVTGDPAAQAVAHGSGAARPKPRARMLAAIAASVTAGVLALAGCGSGASHASGGSGAVVSGTGVKGLTAANLKKADANPNVDPGTSLHGTPAPDFRLTNQFGQRMSLSQFRGKMVLLSFDDDECTTICPLTTTEMVQAKELLGAAGNQVQLLGVNANPLHTAQSDVMAYSRAHGLVNKWDFLTGSKAQLAAVWKNYHVYSQVEHGLIDHTPALYLINKQGREQYIYLTQMAFASISQQAEILAKEIAALLPGHPHVASTTSLASISGLGPRQTVTMPSASPSGGTVTLAAGTPHLVMFFATWLTETSNLKAELTGLNSYAQAARADHLPQLTAVDEAVTEPGPNAARDYLRGLGQPLGYPVGMDITGRIADGYGVQDQPWYTLTSASGKITWSHDGWLSPSALEQAVKQHATGSH